MGGVAKRICERKSESKKNNKTREIEEKVKERKKEREAERGAEFILVDLVPYQLICFWMMMYWEECSMSYSRMSLVK